MVIWATNLIVYTVAPHFERIGAMRQQQITKQPQKRHSETQGDPDRKARREARAEYTRRSAAFLRRLDGR